jgi:hypothetical protein
MVRYTVIKVAILDIDILLLLEVEKYSICPRGTTFRKIKFVFANLIFESGWKRRRQLMKPSQL